MDSEIDEADYWADEAEGWAEVSEPPFRNFWLARLGYEDAALAWPKVAMFLAPPVSESCGLWEIEDVRERVTRPGDWSLWLVAQGSEPHGAWVTRPLVFPRARALEIVFAGGRAMEAWYDLALAETEKYARETGCDRLRGYGRRGWIKFGYRAIGHVFERNLI